MIIHPASKSASAPRWRRASMLLEVSVAMGFTAVLALVMMKASLLGLSGNQWTIMQTLTDAYMTRETALANRLPLADLTGSLSQWPDPTTDTPPRAEQTVSLGKLPGGKSVRASLVRFRSNESPTADTTTATGVWRLYSVLTYKIGDRQYYKSRTTLRMR